MAPGMISIHFGAKGPNSSVATACAAGSHAIGDDINDIPMLGEVKNGYVLGSGYPEAIDYARQNGLYVSKGLYFDGINEIFEEIRRRIEKK